MTTSQDFDKASDMKEDSTSWLGEAGEDDEGSFEPEEIVTLPVGIPKDGHRYRTVQIDELCGIDDHLVVSNKAGGNGAKAMSLVLCRCIQAVEGLLKEKANPEKMFDRQLARAMTNIDRDFLVTRIFMLSDRNESFMRGTCSRGHHHDERVLLSRLPVVKWPDDSPLEVPFKLPIGFPDKTKSGMVYHKDGMMRFPTGKEAELLGNIQNEAEALDALWSACIVRVGELDRVDSDQVMRLKRRDRDALADSMSENLPGIKQGKTIKCPKCGIDMELQLDIASFFKGRKKRGS